MCGRFGLANPHRLKAAGVLDAVLPGGSPPNAVSEEAAALLEPRYNIAPTQPVVAARTRGRASVRDSRARSGPPGSGSPEPRIDVLRWGLIPSWAKDPKIGNSLANARAETVAEKPSFRGAWKAGRRCIVFADLFYEWQDLGDATADPRNGDPGTTGRRPVARAPKPPKRPYAIRLADDAPFAFGGLWEEWRNPEAGAEDAAAWVPTCTLITTAPNALMGRIHDRMPVIVPREHYARWLDPELPLEEARALLTPFAPEAMRAYPVTRAVNDPRNDDPGVLTPLPEEPFPGGPAAAPDGSA